MNAHELTLTCQLRGRAFAIRTLAASLLPALREQGYAMAHTRRLTNPELIWLAEQIGERQSPVQNVRYEPHTSVAGHTKKALTPHCECAYSSQPPRYVLLHCNHAAEAGGDFFLIPMTDVFARISVADRRALRTTKYIVRGVPAKRPLVTEVEGRETLIITGIRQPDGGPHYTFPSESAASLFRRVSGAAAAEPQLRMMHRWRSGDTIIFDNTRFLHGRNAYRGEKRHIKHIRVGRFTP